MRSTFIRHLRVFFPGKSDKDQRETSHFLDLVSAALDKKWRDFDVLHNGVDVFRKKKSYEISGFLRRPQ